MHQLRSSQQRGIPIIMDIEASGFGSLSYPIEVGVVNQDGQRFCRLIKPQQDWTHWDKEAELIHGISRRTLAFSGEQAQVVCHLLNEFLAEQTVFSDGWVVDDAWLIKLFHAGQTTMRFKHSPLEVILSEKQMAIWHTTKDQILLQTSEPRHRASNDAAVIQKTFIATQQLSN